MTKNISILGSTGSIGTSTLDICRQHPDRFAVVGLAAGKNTEVLIGQVREFRPRLVSVHSESEYKKLKPHLPDGVEALFGPDGLRAVATLPESELVVSAIVGAAGLKPTLSAIEAKKNVALANKESLVIAGEILAARAQASGVKILPVDSEHSAIFQCLNGEFKEDVKHIVLTASGGPFFKKPISEFKTITREEALKHPNWDMGAKITIDSATMMNKGLEVMEAHWLFAMPVDKIRVVVHPQSVVHSMVAFVDGSVMAQMGEPDMRVPIAYALSYPRRMPTKVKTLHLPAFETLTFYEPDFEKFKCLKLAYQVARRGQSYPAVLNAANEVAVAAFLNDQIAFTEIPELLDRCVQKHNPFPLTSIDDVLSADRWARGFVQERI